MRNSLGHIIRNSFLFPHSSLVTARTEEELNFLNDWLAGKSAKAVAEKNDTADDGSCARCPGASERREPAGECQNGLMVILNTPSLMSPTERKVFAEEAKTMLKNIIEKAIGIPYASCYITDMIKCGQFESVLPMSKVFENCADHLRREIAENKPSVILVMGEILQLKKIMNENRGIAWYNIDHPLILAKNTDLKKKAWTTIKILNDKMTELGLK